jgi:DNA-binding NarL/FixJ family response regulator
MKPQIRILIVDDHSMARVGLAVPINSQPDMSVVAEAGTAPEAVTLYREHLPDVVTMDYRLVRHTGVQATTAIRAEFPGARILFLSVYEGEEDIFRAADAGASGYLLKSVDGDILLDAIRRIHTGQTVFPPPLAAKLAARRRRESLTERETAILRLIVDGRTNKEIAVFLKLSDALVKLDVRKILEKMGAQDRTRAATLAIERGIVHPEMG